MVTPVLTNRNFFYERLTITADSFPSKSQIEFCFRATHVNITLDGDANGDGEVHFTFRKTEGISHGGELYCTDGPWVADGVGEDKIWFKKPAGGVDIQVRVWAWRK